MRNYKQKTISVLVLMLVITMLFPTMVKASQKSRIKSLLDALNMFVYYNIETNFYFDQENEKKSYTIKMNKMNMASAAALSLSYSEKQGADKSVDFPEVFVTYRLPLSSFKKSGKNLFGKNVSVSDLDKNEKQKASYYAFQRSGYPFVYCEALDTHTEMTRKSFTLKKNSDSGYIVTEKLYWGYYFNDTEKPNYKIIYSIKKNAASSYGYVVKGIKIKRIGPVWGSREYV